MATTTCAPVATGLYDRRYAWRWGLIWTWEYLRNGKLLGALRCLWLSYVLGWSSEACEECGRIYPLWWCEDEELYNRIVGHDDGTGLYCHDCFDALARKQHVVLVWMPVDRERFAKELPLYRDEVIRLGNEFIDAVNEFIGSDEAPAKDEYQQGLALVEWRQGVSDAVAMLERMRPKPEETTA